MLKVIMILTTALVALLSCMFISTNHAWAQDYYTVPQWTKEISDFWSNGQLSDIESVNAFQYLIDKKIIIIPGITFDQTTTFDKKIERTKTLSNFLWNEYPKSTDAKIVKTAIFQQPKTHYVYVQPIPQETQFTSDLILKSTNYWAERTGTKFNIISNPSNATIKTIWLMEPHLEYSGYTVGKTAEVAIGDSKCDSTWHAYNTDFVSSTLTHELGHGFGLGHSDERNDLMFSLVQTVSPYDYISECDIEAMAGLYNGNQKSHVTCTK